MNYPEFLQSKITIAHRAGFEVDDSDLHPGDFPHQRDTIKWACSLGCALIAMSFGLGKTRIQSEIARLVHQRTGKPFLVICPLGVKHQFSEEDGPALDMTWKYVRNDQEALTANTPYLLSNYERVRDGHFSAAFLATLGGVSLDEGSILRSLGSETSDVFKRILAPIPYRYVATATPSPNEHKELIYYAEFLGVMDHGQALTRFFKRDSEHAGHLTLMPSQEEAFWHWVASWALFLSRPSDLGYSDEGYDLPELRIHWHRISVDHTRAFDQMDDRGQRRLLLDSTNSISAATAEKRATLTDRIAKVKQIMTDNPDRHWLLWHHMEDERRAIEKEIPGAVTVYGSQELETREQRIIDFSHGHIPILATKPIIAGSGCNLQRHCYSNIYVGLNFKFQELIQSVHRTYRFLQDHPVDIHFIYAESEDGVVSVIKRKWAEHDERMSKMQKIIRQYGLSAYAIQQGLSRRIGVNRVEVKGQTYTAIHNDCVPETKAMPDNSVGLVLTSIPFGNHYEYSTQYEDFGHNPTDADFWKQMDYLIPELLRVTMPGRLAAIHVKDRQLYGHQTQSGIMETAPFSDECVMAFRKHGWTYQGRRTIVTDVVRENNSTYRLSYGEMLKDASKMSSGLPEYLLLFRKPPTSRETARADVPVTKSRSDEYTICTKCGYRLTVDDYGLEMNSDADREITGVCPHCQEETIFSTGREGGYSLGRWQLDAHSFWRSNGNRPLSPAELVAKYPLPEQVADILKQEHLTGPYDYDRHVAICEELEKRGRLPKFFMLLPPRITRGPADMVWDDCVYMRTLNSNQSQSRKEKHICPLPFDIVDRAIILYSNEGELVYDPFGGIGTVPSRAIRHRRRAIFCELTKDYYVDAVHYCQAAEQDILAPTLFDLATFQAQAAPAD